MTVEFEEYQSFAKGYEWLKSRAGGWQFGEQGMLLALIEQFECKSNAAMFPRVAVEIGAGDGIELPLTLEPLINAGWHVIAYEMDAESRVSLFDRFGGLIVVREEFSSGEQLQRDQPQIVTIDIDGFDYLCMDEVLQNTKPRILMVEHYDLAGPVNAGYEEDHMQASTCPPRWLLGLRLWNNFVIQARAEAIDNLAEWHGYKPVARTRINTIYVSASTAKELEHV